MRWLWLLLLPGLAIAGSLPYEFSGVQQMTFRNGVSPDASYSGMLLQQINQKAKTTSYATWTYAALGDTVGSARKRVLWKCDLSALPDSAVITEAKLRLLLGYSTVSSQFRIQGYRILMPWTSSATWNTRGTATDSTWTVTNAAAAAANWGLADSMGTAPARGTVTLVQGLDDKWPATGEEANFGGREGGGYYTAAGVDSVYHTVGVGLAAAASWARTAWPLFDVGVKTHASQLNDTCWVEIDVTDAVRKWHTKLWANHGLLLTAVGIDAKDDSSFDYDTSSLVSQRPRIVSTAYTYRKSRRPALVVRYVVATASEQSGAEMMQMLRRYFDD